MKFSDIQMPEWLDQHRLDLIAEEAENQVAFEFARAERTGVYPIETFGGCYCGQCGHLNGVFSNFCGQCGSAM